MSWLYLAFVFIFTLFGFVILFGAPYLPTKKEQIQEAIRQMGLKKGQSFIELGCGDGRLQKTAAKNGIKSIGYELNPILVIIAKLSTWRYRHLVKIVWGNFWAKDWPKTDAFYTFLLDKYMAKLDKRMQQYPHKPIKLISYAFEIPNKKHTNKNKGIFTYIYK